MLDGITLSLLPDGIDVLMGPVKSGKSTLFRTLAGLFEGHALHKSWGSVAILGGPVTRENRPRLVQQHAKTLDLSLLEALLQPIRETEKRSSAEWRRAGLEWLAAYGLGDLAAEADQPLLYCNIRAQRCVQILAQLLLKPSLLMIDEPTDGLAAADAAWLADWIRKVSQHCKLWIVVHNQVQARRLADRIALIGGGRLLAYQDATSFFQRPANEWVEQFLRTGGLTLPVPDARAQDPADDVPAPSAISVGARAAIEPYPMPSDSPVCQETTVIDVSDTTGSFHAFADGRSTAEHQRARELAEIPAPSRDGVALAAAVGEFIFRDSGAPRGFHWIVPGKLAGCPAPGVVAAVDDDLGLLVRAGITGLITLTEADIDQEALRRHNLKNIHLSVFGREAPSIGQAHMLLVRMQKLIEAGEVLAVHCKAGLGRTGAVLAAWLIREGGLTAEDSMIRLRKIDPGFIQSKEQEDFLHRYEADFTQRLI